MSSDDETISDLEIVLNNDGLSPIHNILSKYLSVQDICRLKKTCKKINDSSACKSMLKSKKPKDIPFYIFKRMYPYIDDVFTNSNKIVCACGTKHSWTMKAAQIGDPYLFRYFFKRNPSPRPCIIHEILKHGNSHILKYVFGKERSRHLLP